MNRKTMITFAAALGAFAALGPTTVFAASPNAAKLSIRHQVRGCHMWSLNGGSYGVVQNVRLSRGGALTITNNDMMPHQLIKLTGPSFVERLVSPGTMSMGKLKAPYTAGMMPHMGASLRVTFNKAGVYKLHTKAGEDYMPVKTSGVDNVLRVTVTVS